VGYFNFYANLRFKLFSRDPNRVTIEGVVKRFYFPQRQSSINSLYKDDDVLSLTQWRLLCFNSLQFSLRLPVEKYPTSEMTQT